MEGHYWRGDFKGEEKRIDPEEEDPHSGRGNLRNRLNWGETAEAIDPKSE